MNNINSVIRSLIRDLPSHKLTYVIQHQALTYVATHELKGYTAITIGDIITNHMLGELKPA